MKIASIMTTKPHLIAPNDTVLNAAQKMKSYGCGILPVGDVKNIVGVITDRDIIIRAIAMESNVNSVLVKEIMTPKPFFCDEDDYIQSAAAKMSEYHTRRALVKDKNNILTGIVSLGDIIRRVEDKNLLSKIFSEMSVA